MNRGNKIESAVFILRLFPFTELAVSFVVSCMDVFNPLVMNGLSHCYHLDKSTFIFGGIKSHFHSLFHFWIKFLLANRIVPDGTPCSAAMSHLGLDCLPMSHKKGAGLTVS